MDLGYHKRYFPQRSKHPVLILMSARFREAARVREGGREGQRGHSHAGRTGPSIPK